MSSQGSDSYDDTYSDSYSDDSYEALSMSEDGSLHSSDWSISDDGSDETWTLSSDSSSGED